MSQLRSVGLLAAGTAVAHVVGLAAAPLLTRLYTPTEFGLLAVFTSIVGIASVVVSLRLELAVPVPPAEEDAAQVVAAGMVVAAVVAGLVAVLVAALGDEVSAALGVPELAPLLGFAPVYLAAWGAYSMLNFWFARRDRFAVIAVVNAVRAVAVAAGQGLLGLTRTGGLGLIAGHALGPVVLACGLLLAVARGDGASPVVRLSWRGVVGVLRRFRSFVVFGTPQALVNALNQSLPAVVMTLAFSASVAGFYLMAHRLIAAPIGLLGRSVRQVIYPRLARAVDEGTGLPLAVRATLRMAALALPAALVVFFSGPALFAWLLGQEWRVAGEYARFIALWLAMGFVNIPSVSLVPLLGMQRWHAAYEVVYLGARLAALLYGASVRDPMAGIAWFALVGVAFNAVLVVVPLWRLRSARAPRGG